MSHRPASPLSSCSLAISPGWGSSTNCNVADVFVYYDDVQYDKHGWRNRNRIKTQNGPLWLTVPVRHRGEGFPRILDVEIDRRTSWARKHIASVRQAYARAPFLSRYLPELEALLQREWTHLVDLDIACVDLMASWLGIRRRVERSSCLGIDGERSERLVNVCRRFGATKYVSGDAAQSVSRCAALRTAWHCRRMAAVRASGLSADARSVRPVSVRAGFTAELRRRGSWRARGDARPLNISMSGR